MYLQFEMKHSSLNHETKTSTGTVRRFQFSDLACFWGQKVYQLSVQNASNNTAKGEVKIRYQYVMEKNITM